jgi:hypothetical protein
MKAPRLQTRSPTDGTTVSAQVCLHRTSLAQARLTTLPQDGLRRTTPQNSPGPHLRSSSFFFFFFFFFQNDVVFGGIFLIDFFFKRAF